jgi:hypothetical protein
VVVPSYFLKNSDQPSKMNFSNIMIIVIVGSGGSLYCCGLHHRKLALITKVCSIARSQKELNEG